MTLGPLSTHLKKFDYENKLEELSRLVETCVPQVSFWGSRVVTAPNYSGSVSLEWLTRQVQLALYKKQNNNSFSLAARIAGLDIVKKLQGLYKKTDKQIHSKCFLTRFFNWIREFSILPYTTRFYLEKCNGQDFRTYTRDKVIEVFHAVPPEVNSSFFHMCCDDCGPKGWVLKEENLRRRLAQGFTE